MSDKKSGEKKKRRAVKPPLMPAQDSQEAKENINTEEQRPYAHSPFTWSSPSDYVVSRIRLFRRNYDMDRKIELLAQVGAVVVAFLFLVITSVITCSQLGVMEEQGKAMIESNRINREAMIGSTRAWIAPIGAKIDGKIAAGTNLRVKIMYENVGKEAADDVVHTWGASKEVFPVTIDAKQMPYIDVTNVPWPVNNLCEIDPFMYSNRRTVYPSSHNEDIRYLFNLGPSFLPQSVMEGKSSFYIYGCFVYRSFEKIRRSPYCFYLQPARGLPPDKWTFESCQSGSANAD